MIKLQSGLSFPFPIGLRVIHVWAVWGLSMLFFWLFSFFVSFFVFSLKLSSCLYFHLVIFYSLWVFMSVWVFCMHGLLCTPYTLGVRGDGAPPCGWPWESNLNLLQQDSTCLTTEFTLQSSVLTLKLRVSSGFESSLLFLEALSLVMSSPVAKLLWESWGW